MRGAIWGDPYTIGGKRGMIPPASLSRVYSPPQQRGAMGPLGQPPKVGGAILEPLMPFETNRGFTDLRTGGPRWHPPLLGGVVL